MKKIFILVITSVVLAGCGKEKSVQIKGSLRGSNAEYIFLQELTGNQKAVADSVQLNSDGEFSFKYKISQPSFFSLKVNNKPISLLAFPGDKIIINGDARHLPATYSVEGSEESSQIRNLYQRMDHAITVGDSLEKTLQTYVGNRNFVNIQKQFEWNYLAEIDSLRAYNIRFMRNNPKSLVVIYALYQQVDPGAWLFSRDGDIKYFRKADSTFYKLYPQAPYVKMLHANVLDLNERNRVLQLEQLMSLMGAEAPDIALPSPDGTIIRLSDKRGQYVLLDFWASWSAPCRTENYVLVNTYNKFHSQGFEVYQVSLDNDKAMWERAIKEDQLNWIHVSDLKFWDSEVVKRYGVETLPASFLIDKDGTIIAKDLRGEALDKRLTELIAGN